MAKNKQKAPTQPQTTKKLDLCDQRKVERFVASEFDVARQYRKKIGKAQRITKKEYLASHQILQWITAD